MAGLVELAQALAVSDARAERILSLLRKRKPPLDELEAEALGEPNGGGPDSEQRLDFLEVDRQKGKS
jgi:hypothetical protein